MVMSIFFFIAADSAATRGVAPLQNPQANKVALLQDAEYRAAITQETMRKSNIERRVSKASRYLFGVDYE